MHAYLTRDELEERKKSENESKNVPIIEIHHIPKHRRKHPRKMLVNKMMGCFSCTRMSRDELGKT